jgi:hypothetical protein
MSKRKHYICLYDLEGKLLSARPFSCLGCAKKRVAKTTPACIRLISATGKIEYANGMYKKLEEAGKV